MQIHFSNNRIKESSVAIFKTFTVFLIIKVIHAHCRELEKILKMSKKPNLFIGLPFGDKITITILMYFIEDHFIGEMYLFFHSIL